MQIVKFEPSGAVLVQWFHLEPKVDETRKIITRHNGPRMRSSSSMDSSQSQYSADDHNGSQRHYGTIYQVSALNSTF